METQDYASLRLRSDVIDKGLCSLCGGCASGCPYIAQFQGRIVQLDCCPLPEGSCYRYCPRTFTDLDELSQAVFGQPFSSDDLGVVRSAYLARATDPNARGSAGGGGVIAAVLGAALKGGIIEAVLASGSSGDAADAMQARNLATSPQRADALVPLLLTDMAAIETHMAAPYRASRVLAAFNSVPRSSGALLGMVCLPCQVASMRKRVNSPSESRADAGNVRLLIAEACAAKRWLEQGEDRQAANKACSYCWDLTGELADISVGTGRGEQGWDTVLIRTAAGERAFDAARNSGAIETRALPAENLAREQKASRDKKTRAIRNLAGLSGSEENLGYLGLPRRVIESLGSSS